MNIVPRVITYAVDREPVNKLRKKKEVSSGT
jgi:hypothetical protein